jgi:hypothetical protein
VGHRPAGLEVAQVLDEERRVERVGVVVVDGGALLLGQAAAVLVVRVLRDLQALGRAEPCDQLRSLVGNAGL